VYQKNVEQTWDQGADKNYSNASPFWRTSSANSQREQKQQATPERKVIGASYSHADILKFDNLYAIPKSCVKVD
jgi:hypothetical protein